MSESIVEASKETEEMQSFSVMGGAESFERVREVR
jgi:hypothetical protein